MSCLTPISIKPTKEKPARDGFFYHVVPCGKCPACRLRRIQGWVFRLKQEDKIHKSSWFVTLTYDNPPISHNGFMTLQKSDLRNFFKRLRKNTKTKTIKYYACGEYGTTSFRPHYHAIMFDCQPDDIINAWQSGHSDTDLFKRGHCHFGNLTDDSIAYTAKYMAKESRIPMHDHDDRVPEYSVMSKRLGSNYLTPQVVAYHKNQYKSYLTMPGGATHAMPRYYRDKIFSEEDRLHMQHTLSNKFDDEYQKGVEKYGSPTEYLAAMHYAIKDAIKNFNKSNKRNTL